MQKDKPEWEKPKLIVLIRDNNMQEKVLALCKYQGTYGAHATAGACRMYDYDSSTSCVRCRIRGQS